MTQDGQPPASRAPMADKILAVLVPCVGPASKQQRAQMLQQRKQKSLKIARVESGADRKDWNETEKAGNAIVSLDN